MSKLFSRRKIDLMLEMCEREGISEDYDPECCDYEDDDCEVCGYEDDDDEYCDDEEDELEELLDELDEVPEELAYTAEMVVVLGVNNGFCENYVVEYDMLVKLMESQGIDEKTALTQVCEANNIDFDRTYLLIESSDEFKEDITEARCKGGSKAVKDRAGKLNKKIKDLKKKGVKMMKKKK